MKTLTLQQLIKILQKLEEKTGGKILVYQLTQDENKILGAKEVKGNEFRNPRIVIY